MSKRCDRADAAVQTNLAALFSVDEDMSWLRAEGADFTRRLPSWGGEKTHPWATTRE